MVDLRAYLERILRTLGEPLVARTIRIAKESNCFDRIIVNTDDNEIAEVAENAGAEFCLGQKKWVQTLLK